MARYNKIFAGPVTENIPQVRELPAAAATLPGCAVVSSSGAFALSGATTVSKIYVAQDNYLTMRGVDEAIATGDRVIGMELLPEELFNVRVPTGTNVALDAALTTGAAGKWVLAAAGRPVYAYAEEAYNNTSGADQLVRVRAAVGGRTFA